MIYYATREDIRYLRKLANCAQETVDHDLVSVIGGLGFLHAMGPHTQAIHLVDRSKDGVAYCKAIIGLIRDCSTFELFRTALMQGPIDLDASEEE